MSGPPTRPPRRGAPPRWPRPGGCCGRAGDGGAEAGLVVMLAVDTLMTGRAAGREVAYLGLGLSPLMAFMLASVGLLQGAMVLVAQANETRLCPLRRDLAGWR
ncbi:MAG: hypothetical protein U1F24_08190 [Alphaproteobacteria bacterium]